GIDLEVDAPQSPTPEQVPLKGLFQARYHGDTQTLDVAAVNLATRAIRVNATGQLGTDKAQAKIAINATDLHEIRPMLAALSPGTRIPVVLQGRASFNGAISGKLNALSARGRLEMEDFDSEMAPLQLLEASAAPQISARQVRRIHWDSLITDLSYSPSSLNLQNGAVRRGKANATFSAAASLRQGMIDDNSAINLTLHLQDAPVEDLQPLLGLTYPITGMLGTDVHSTGTPANPKGGGKVQ